MNEAVPATQSTLSDRVRSLRLTDDTGVAGASRWSWIPWAGCVLLALISSAFALEALWPISDEFIQKLATDRGLNIGQGTATSNNPTTTNPGTTPTPSGDSSEIALEAKGYVVPISLIQVSPKVGGTVMKLYFKEGDVVTEGKPLAELERSEFQFDRDRAFATKVAAERRVDELKKYLKDEIEQTETDWKDAVTQRDQAQAKYQRYVLLKQRGSLSPEDYELAESTAKSMDFRARRLELTYKLIKDEGRGPRYEKIASAEADVKQAKADLDKADWRLGNTTVLAPRTGVILTKKTEEGNIVNPSAFSNGLSASLCEMADLYKLEIDLSIAERDIAKVFEKQECRMRTEAYPNRIYKGYVSRIMPKADQGKSAVPVRVMILFPADDPNGKALPKDRQAEFLRPDMGALVTFTNRVSKLAPTGK